MQHFVVKIIDINRLKHYNNNQQKVAQLNVDLQKKEGVNIARMA